MLPTGVVHDWVCELQLMDEGQKLSKRQLELEGSVKKLRQQLKASEAEREKLSALLSAESAEAEAMRRAKAKAERDLVAAVEAGRQEVEAVRQQAQADMLNTQAEQVGVANGWLDGLCAVCMPPSPCDMAAGKVLFRPSLDLHTKQTRPSQVAWPSYWVEAWR